jgi:hypothetical protein
MDLNEYIEILPEKKAINLSIKLLEILLPEWEKFAKKPQNLSYFDTVVGLQHKVDKKIIHKTILISKNWLKNSNSKLEIEKLLENYVEPIVALQDEDWIIPQNIKLIFYSAYNLMCKLNGETETIFGENQTYLTVNQAIDAILKSKILSENQIFEILEKHKK